MATRSQRFTLGYVHPVPAGR